MKSIDIIYLKTDKKKYLDKNIFVCGWVRSSRDSKNTSFLEINDGTYLSHLQVVIDKNKLNFNKEIMNLGTAVEVEGVLKQGFKNNEDVELNATAIKLIGKCPLDYPIQKKSHTFEFLRTIPHLRIRSNTFSAIFRLRSKISYAIHNFFQSRNFLYIHTPIITGSDCEGGGEIFRISSLNYEDIIKCKNEQDFYEQDFFKRKAGLTVSGQLEAEAMASCFKRVYTFGPTFRAENSNTSRHVAEFWQIEPEIAFANLNDAISLAEDLIKYLLEITFKDCYNELEFFDKRIENGLIDKLKKVKSVNFEICDYTEAIKILDKADKKFEYPVKWGIDLQSEHERYLCEIVFKKPVFIINYPKDVKSFYMKINPDGKTVAAADLLTPSIGEIIGCSERENDYNILKKVIEERKMNLKDYEDYLELRKYGSVPHSGFGLGLERFLMYISGIGNIRDTQIYPRSKGELR